MAVAIYALINAAISILSGGHELRFDLAIVYALYHTRHLCSHGRDRSASKPPSEVGLHKLWT